MNIDGIIEAAAKEIKDIKDEKTTARSAASIIFPVTRSQEIRISEQELKVLFCAGLLNNNKIFSVETPTRGVYAFSGINSESGNLDVCVYEYTGKYRRANCIELKAHNTECKTDFEKLICEEGENYFIHILPGIDNGTLYRQTHGSRTPVINKYVDAIKTLYADAAKIKRYTKLTFYICVLNPFLLLKNTIDSTDSIETIVNKMELLYTVRNGSFIPENNNWSRILPAGGAALLN
jgi:hypothetical protein